MTTITTKDDDHNTVVKDDNLNHEYENNEYQNKMITSFDIVSNPSLYHDHDLIYHMCPKHEWENAVQNEIAYYPSTFRMDGYFIHASYLPQNLIVTANHFYQHTIGDWICLAVSITALHQKCGIITKYELPKPVGDITTTPTHDFHHIYPHIFGGIPTRNNSEGIVLRIYNMQRHHDTGIFYGIDGLC